MKKKSIPLRKYVLELSETQAQAMVAALESFTRLGMGQYSAAMELSIPFTKFPGYNRELEACYRQIKSIIHGLTGSEYYSISSSELPESVKVAHDIFQVVRHRLAWDRNPEGGFTVDFSPPLKVSKEILPILKEIKNDDPKNKL